VTHLGPLNIAFSFIPFEIADGIKKLETSRYRDIIKKKEVKEE